MLAITELRDSFRGRVIGPDDNDYDQARAVFPGGFDRRPSVIIRVADAGDVARAVALARDNGLEVSVRSGGHSGLGYGVCDGGLVIDVRDLNGLDIDVAGRTAWAGAGLTAAEYSAAAAEHGLATGFGDTGSVGLGGIVLGGGVGFLVRKHGMTIDDVLAVEIVMADGSILQVDEESHPDLFWAIRGGGGNFGVATRFRLRLHPLDGIVGGMLMLPATPELVARFLELAEEAPEELSTIANVMPAPPMPFIPADQHGRLVVMALVAYAGGPEDGERALAPFRALATPIVDMVQPMPYPQIFGPEDDSYHPTAVGENLFVDSVDEKTAAMICQTLAESDASLRVAQLRVLGGAMARVPADATAFAHRTDRIMVNVAAFYDGPDDRVRRQSWVDDFAGALGARSSGAYVGFLNTDGAEQVRRAYPDETRNRLAEIKHRYDPGNLFHGNINIVPAAPAVA